MTIDTATLSLIQQIQAPTLTTISKTISTIFDPIILAITAIIISAILYAKKQKTKSILLFSTAIITAIIIETLKQIIKRPRPIPALSYAFPSGHTTMAVVFFGLITHIFTKKQNKSPIIISTLIILTIAFTRIYLQAHWLTDVIAGAVLGLLILTISILIHKKIT